MRIWLPIIIIIAALSAAFSWLSIQMAASTRLPDWKRIAETNREPGKLVLEPSDDPAAGYTVKRLSDEAQSSIRIEAGKRVIDKEHSVEVKLRNAGQGPVELMWTNDPACGCVSPVMIDGKELERRKTTATIEPGKESVIRIRWKATEAMLPERPERGFTLNLHFDVRNDPNFTEDLILQVSCVFVRPPMEGN